MMMRRQDNLDSNKPLSHGMIHDRKKFWTWNEQ